MSENIFLYVIVISLTILVIGGIFQIIKKRKKEVEKAKNYITLHNCTQSQQSNLQSVGRAVRDPSHNVPIGIIEYLGTKEPDTTKDDDYSGSGGGFGGGGASGTWDNDDKKSYHSDPTPSYTPSYDSGSSTSSTTSDSSPSSSCD